MVEEKPAGAAPGRWHKLRPKGFRFSFAGAVFALFTGTLAFLMVRFPMFHSIKLGFASFLFINVLFFIRFREKPRKSLMQRLMATRFFPRKLAFTMEGKFMVIISLGMGFAAVNTGSNLLYLLLAMLLSLITASGILSEFSVQKLNWTVSFPEQVVARTETLFPIRLRNDKRRLSSFSLEGEALFPDESPLTQIAGTLLKLEPGMTNHLFARVTFSRRGSYALRGLSLGTRYPFSFFKKSRNYELSQEVVVVPKGEEDVDHLVFALATGFEEHARLVGRGSEFFSVRPMQPGDEWRDVHWKQSARHLRFAVKEYEALTARRVWVELAPGGGERDLEREEEAVELAASLVRRLVQGGFEVGLKAPGAWLPPTSGPACIRQAFTTLALLDLGAAAADASLRAPAGGPNELTVAVDIATLEVTISGGATATRVPGVGGRRA